jgi:hypothetical protein
VFVKPGERREFREWLLGMQLAFQLPANQIHGKPMHVTPVVAIPLSVITAREPVPGNRWISERWNVVGVIAGGDGTGGMQRRLLRSGPEGEQFLWSGLVLALRKGEVDSYYHNIVGQSPSIYVYCEHDNDGEPRPRSVTADYIDALSHGEFGNATFRVPMPADVYRYIETFVLEHYAPDEPKTKRKHEPRETKTSGIWGDE